LAATLLRHHPRHLLPAEIAVMTLPEMLDAANAIRDAPDDLALLGY
jgi:hypothetical protein